MAKKALQPRLSFMRTGPAQYVNRAGILRKAGDCIAPWGNRALISGGNNALAAAADQLTKSRTRPASSGASTCSPAKPVPPMSLNQGRGGETSEPMSSLASAAGNLWTLPSRLLPELSLPVVCIPTIAATCAATTALSVIYNDRGEFVRASIHARNPSLVLVDPEIITRSPGIYLRAGILDSLAKWYEGRSVWPCVQNPDVQTSAAIQLAEVLYKGHRKHASEAVRLNAEHRVDNALIQTLDLVILLTGMIQTLAKGTLFTAIAHSLHNGMTLMKESHGVLHGLKVGYGIIVQFSVEKCPKKEFTKMFFPSSGNWVWSPP